MIISNFYSNLWQCCIENCSSFSRKLRDRYQFIFRRELRRGHAFRHHLYLVTSSKRRQSTVSCALALRSSSLVRTTNCFCDQLRLILIKREKTSVGINGRQEDETNGTGERWIVARLPRRKTINFTFRIGELFQAARSLRVKWESGDERKESAKRLGKVRRRLNKRRLDGEGRQILLPHL